MLGCKHQNNFHFLQSLQLHHSEFRQTDGINHFVQRLIMDGDGFRQNGAMNIYRSNLRGKGAVQVVMLIHHYTGHSGKMTNDKG